MFEPLAFKKNNLIISNLEDQLRNIDKKEID